MKRAKRRAAKPKESPAVKAMEVLADVANETRRLIWQAHAASGRLCNAVNAHFATTHGVVEASRKVVARWEAGDLAGAVRELDKALHAYDGKEYKP